MSDVVLLQGTALHLPLRDASVQCVVTSPPYFGLRSYGIGTEHGEIGLEPTLDAYLAAMVAVFKEVWRVLRDDGTCWVNIGDSYNAGTTAPRQPTRTGMVGRSKDPGVGNHRTNCPELKVKDLCMVPARLALALQDTGWYLRSAITWCKRAPMPESVQDRPTSATEMVYLLTKSPTYFYDATAVRVQEGNGWHGSSFQSAHDVMTKPGLGQQPRQEHPGRNLWNYWVLGPEPTSFGHYASFPTELVRRCILAGTSAHGCCAACGAPWGRVVERSPLQGEAIIQQSARPAAEIRGVSPGSLLRTNGRTFRTTQTHGWTPTCACAAPVQPCTVLDPFAGSGTTLLVARALGRHAVGVDLSWPYLHTIVRERLGLTALQAWQHGAPPQHDRFEDLPLFQEAATPDADHA